MIKWIETLTGNYTSSARVVDGTLVISLPQAMTPVVWRMELGHVRASALEVRKGDEGTFILTLKTPKGDVYDIAPFAQRGPAVEALMAVSRAMEHAHGQIRPAVANTAGVTNLPALRPEPRPMTKGRVMTALIGTALLFGLIGMFMNMGGGRMGQIPNSSFAEQSSTAGEAAGQSGAPTGVPLSADSFLNNR